MASNQDDVLIIGAGVAGLVLAQGLKYRGIPFKVFERDESLSTKDQGYRFRCEAPGLEALEETISPELWDLLEMTHPKDSPPVLTILDPYTSEKKGEMNTIPDLSPRGQRCYPIDRPWFRELLYSRIEDDVFFGKGFESYSLFDEDGRQRIRVSFTDQTIATGRLVVAADGVRSRIRRQMLPHLKQVDVERMIVWGRTALNPALRAQLPSNVFVTHFATAIDPRHPTRCVLFAPIEWPKDLPSLSGGKLSPQDDYVFWALSTEAQKSLTGSDTTVEEKIAWVDMVTSEWDAGLQVLFKLQDIAALSILPVYSSFPDLGEWETNPCITLLGDAIHAMAPTGGVGGRTAIEDARDLCIAIAAVKGEEDPKQVRMTEELKKYEEKMRARARTSVEQSFRGGKQLWAGKEWWEYTNTI